METTLRKIGSYNPCGEGIKKLMIGLGYDCEEYECSDVYKKLSNDEKDKPIDFKFILENNGIKDTFWALRTQDEKTVMRIGAYVAESVLHIFEKNRPGDLRPRVCIKGIRDFCDGKISINELRKLRSAAYAAADATAATYAAAYATYADATAATYAAAYATYAAATAATYAAAYAADAADAYAATYAAAAAAAADATAADADATAAARKKQWQVNEEILRKYI